MAYPRGIRLPGRCGEGDGPEADTQRDDGPFTTAEQCTSPQGWD
jgi:hypothetical protein